jgi:internalin A
MRFFWVDENSLISQQANGTKPNAGKIISMASLIIFYEIYTKISFAAMSEEALGRIAECKRTKSKKLDLSGCGIEGTLPMELGDLTWLEELIFSDLSERCQSVKSIEAISSLVNLRKLDLRNTDIDDLTHIAGLGRMQTLYLSGTCVENLTPISGLHQLEWLFLDATAVKEIVALKAFTNLRFLDMSKTKTRDLSPLSGFLQLQYLNISDTEVEDLTPIQGLIRLAHLKFDKNKIKFVPKEILELGTEAVLDYLRRNAKDAEANLAPKPNWLLKLIIVGNSKTGKSSLICSWMAGLPQYAEMSTEWLGNCSWPFNEDDLMNLSRPQKPGSPTVVNVRGTPTLNIFDFGGQDFYHDTHHLFFSSDTAYVVLWDAEHDKIGQEKDDDGILQTTYPLNYWLDAIRYHCQVREAGVINWDVIEAAMADPNLKVTIGEGVFDESLDIQKATGGEDSVESVNEQSDSFLREVPEIEGVYLPLHALVLQSRIDESPRSFPNIVELKQRFPWIYDFDAVSMNPQEPARLELTLSKLKEMIRQIPLLGSPFSASWMWVRDALIDGKYDQIIVTPSEFRDWANSQIDSEAPKLGVAASKVNSLYFEAREIESLLKYLSSLGIVLHYPSVNTLRERVFLKPQIIRNQVIKVLQGLKGGNGYFSTEEVQNRLSEVSSGLDATQLLALMQEFKMAFEVGGKNSGKWVAPLYLPAKAPAGMEMLLEVFDKPIRRIVYPNFIHKSVTLELFQAFSQDLLPDSDHGLASERHVVWRDGMVIRLKDTLEMVLVKFFIGSAATALHDAQEAHIEVYAFKTPSGNPPAHKVQVKLQEINRYWHTREEVTVDGKSFVPIETLQAAAKAHDTHFSHFGKSYPLEAYRAFVPIPWKRIFISYAAQDEGYCTELIKHLSPLNRTKRIAIWEKAQLLAGSERRLVQRDEMDRADILILLISADYFHDSEGELMEEYTAALNRAQERNATITYVLIRDCDYESTELAAYRGLLGDGQVIGDGPRNDAGWKQAVGELKKLLPSGKEAARV